MLFRFSRVLRNSLARNEMKRFRQWNSLELFADHAMLVALNLTPSTTLSTLFCSVLLCSLSLCFSK